MAKPVSSVKRFDELSFAIFEPYSAVFGIVVIWFGLVWFGLAVVAWIVFTKEQMPEFVYIVGVFLPDVSDRDGPRGKPQVGGRDFNLPW